MFPDFAVLTLECQTTGKMVKVQIWDTAGQERFRSIASSYFRSADGVMMVFDRTKVDTLRGIEEIWLPEVRRQAKHHSLIGLVGNKTDLPADASCEKEAARLAKDYQLGVVPSTSARTGKAVTPGFLQFIAAMVRSKLEADGEKGRPLLHVRKAEINTEGAIDLKRPVVRGKGQAAWWKRLFCNLI